jgi:hypothetical protein
MINAGIDPRTATGMTDALRTGIVRWLRRDQSGARRASWRKFDLGAYERH